jgi:hypothetical protein
MSLLELLAQVRVSSQPGGNPPWPGTLDAPRWLWNSGVPNYWQDTYDSTPDYASYIINPGVWGLTGLSYTVPTTQFNAPTTKTAGYTMGEGGRYDLRFEIKASFGYRLWEGMMEPLAWARILSDRVAARLDPEQAIESELPRLGVWTNVDPVSAESMPVSLLRRYIHYNRTLERLRGTDASAEVLGTILGGVVSISWSATPLVKIVAFYGAISNVARRLLRRHIPPHLGMELHAFTGLAAYTGLAYTATSTNPDHSVPAAAIQSSTSSLTEVVEYL